MELINWKLVSHPLNWAVIFMMLFLAAILGTLALQGLGITPATGDDETGT